MKKPRMSTIGLAVCAFICAASAPSRAEIFETHFSANFHGGSVGKYTTSGATVNRNLVSGLLKPDGIAVSGDKLFVVDVSAGTIGEYTTSGAVVKRTLISGLHVPVGIAVSGEFLYVTELFGGIGGIGTVGKYTISGETVNAALISGMNVPKKITI